MPKSSDIQITGSIPSEWLEEILPILLQRFSNVLLVDDSEFLCTIMSTFFQLEGFTTSTALDGNEAIKAFQKEIPDIAFIDLVMPNLSGLEVAKTVRLSDNPKIPVLVALSGRDDEEYRRKAAMAGFDHFLVKPIDPAALRGFLASLVIDSKG